MPPDDPRARLRATVALVEPLGAKDVVHLDVGDHSVRVVSPPGRRPHVGDGVGIACDPGRVLRFDDETDMAI